MKTLAELQQKVDEIRTTLRNPAWSNYYPLQQELKRTEGQLHSAKINDLNNS